MSSLTYEYEATERTTVTVQGPLTVAELARIAADLPQDMKLDGVLFQHGAAYLQFYRTNKTQPQG